MAAIILIANPGSASRKYALFAGEDMRAELHFEYVDDRVVYTLMRGRDHQQFDTELHDVAEAAGQIVPLLRRHSLLEKNEKIERIGLRVVAPSGFFLQDHIIDDGIVARLRDLESRAPLHISATLRELDTLRQQFTDTTIAGLSDSAFHSSKPEHAWNYGLPLKDTDQLEIKRYGYHGLSAASVVHELRRAGKLPAKLIICHLGSGASVTAVHGGKSVDNTMGYSPLEGLIMATRSGSVDHTALRVLKSNMQLDDAGFEKYLNEQSGLQGLGGSSDIRELLKREQTGDHYARLALNTYVYNVQKAIGQMTAALGGVDMLVFTATVGERAAAIREHIVKPLHYLDLTLDSHANQDCTFAVEPTCISRLGRSRPIYVIPANESAEMARRVLAI